MNAQGRKKGKFVLQFRLTYSSLISRKTMSHKNKKAIIIFCGLWGDDIKYTHFLSLHAFVIFSFCMLYYSLWICQGLISFITPFEYIIIEIKIRQRILPTYTLVPIEFRYVTRAPIPILQFKCVFNIISILTFWK